MVAWIEQAKRNMNDDGSSHLFWQKGRKDHGRAEGMSEKLKTVGFSNSDSKCI